MSAEWQSVGGGVDVRLSTSGGNAEERHARLCTELRTRICQAAREIAAGPVYAELQPHSSVTGDPIEAIEFPGVQGTLSLGEHPSVTCQCGARCYGDSLNDAVTSWTSHITKSECREAL